MDFNREKIYQCTVSTIRQWLDDGIITDDEFIDFLYFGEWDEYLPGGPFCIYGKQGSEAERFADRHPFIFKESTADNH